MSKIAKLAIQSLLVSASLTLAQTNISEMPANLRESIEWVWNNRIVPKSAAAPIGEGSTVRQNLIFDQIYDNNGSLNYVIRWQSTKPLSLAQRKGMETMVQRQINNWTQYLVGFEGWPFKDVAVKVVGVAVDNAALILDPQPGEVIYTAYSSDPVHNDDANIPANLPNAPLSCSRMEHWNDPSYTYASCPQGSKGRFDMYLWATANWNGGVGGDWGQRMAETYFLNNLTTAHITMLEHEMGHGFGITDFYGTAERPPNGFPTKLVMWAGNSPSITEWDAWMLRYIWSKLKADKVRFPPKPAGVLVQAKPTLPFFRIDRSKLEIKGAFDRVEIFDIRRTRILEIASSHSELSKIDVSSLPKGVLKVRISKDGMAASGSILHE
jgi:hypothetical protein